MLLTMAHLDAAEDEELDYAVTDTTLKVVRLDSDPRESFLGMQCDTKGRLFVGGREALFVYEPDANSPTGFGPRQELYRFPDHTWVYDIAIRGNDLYVLTVSALYLIPDAVVKREGLKPKRLIWGVPLGHVHQCFHGMAIGPEGDIYFAMGDPVWYYGDFNRPDHWGHWTFFSTDESRDATNWRRTPYSGVGGVFRCRPDGTKFQVVARGLRNPCGLCFDKHWNLFTNDNDHESLPAQYVPGRLIHVTPHAYFNWPQGWMPSKTPDRADLLETMFDGMGRAVPVGQAYYDDAYLPERLRGNLLVARWCIRAVTNYPYVRRGASFQVTEEQTLLQGRNDARPVSVTVGRGGRIFVTIAYMAHNEGSPIYRSDLVMITRQDDEPPYRYDGYEATKATSELLFGELSEDSWSARARAHTEILRRGGEMLDYAASRIRQTKETEPEWSHLLWMLAANRKKTAAKNLHELWETSLPECRASVVRAICESMLAKQNDHVYSRPDRDSLFPFRLCLDDPNPFVQHAGLIALLETRQSFDETKVRTDFAQSTDTYLRQAAVLLLAERGRQSDFQFLVSQADAASRLGGVLAAGFRLTLLPLWHGTSPLPPLDELRGFEITFADEKIDLRQWQLGPMGNFTIADWWKHRPQSKEKNTSTRMKLRGMIDDEYCFGLLVKSLDDEDEQVRLQAAQFLYLLNDPRTEPLVQKVRRDSEDRRLSLAPLKLIDKLWLAGPFDDGDQGFERVHPPEQGPIDLSAAYAAGDRKIEWREEGLAGKSLYDLGKLLTAGDRQSCYAYFQFATGGKQRINLLVGSDDGVKVWQNGQVVWTNDVTRGALPTQDVIPIDLQPGSNDILIRVRNQTGSTGFYAHYRALGSLLLSLPEKSGPEGLAERLKSAGEGAAKIPEEFLTVDWPAAIREGDAERGRKLFEAIGCAKCHATTAEANVIGGPSLADSARRFTVAYLVESILAPSKQLSPIFRATTIVTKEGETLTGLVIGETGDKVELLLPDTKRPMIDKAQIEDRQLVDLSPMPQGVVKRPDELRDLLAFLLMLK